jgi:hypothetical protein
MSIIVSLTVPDAVILGVDSAVSIPGVAGLKAPETDELLSEIPESMREWARGPVIKVYEDAHKLFPLGNRPVGVAIYGTQLLGDRTIGNHLHEFVAKDPEGIIGQETTLQQIAEGVNAYFTNLYDTIAKPFVANFRKMPFDQVPVEQRPGYGFVIGGYSANAYFPEVFHVFVPNNSGPQRMRQQRELNVNWFGTYEPLDRYFKGYTQPLVESLLEQFKKIHGSDLSEEEQAGIYAALAKYEYTTTASLMPVSVGVEYVRFLVGLVTNHYRYDVGMPIVGGPIRIGKATYAAGTFEILK